MSDTRVELNRKLMILQNYFNKTENYSEYQEKNVGYRSLKNLAVWLFVYALVDEKQKTDVLIALRDQMPDDLFFGKSVQTLHGGPVVHAINEYIALFDELSRVENLKLAIEDYEKANGTFSVGITPEYFESAKAYTKQILPGLEKYITNNPADGATASFTMKNIVNLKWATLNGKEAVYKKTTGMFKGKAIDYFKTDSEKDDTSHKIVTYQASRFLSYQYHVVKLGTVVQGEKKQNTLDKKSDAPTAQYCYLLEPVDKDNEKSINALRCLQEDFHNILVEANRDPSTYVPTNIHFPQLKGELKTTEKRLGPYAAFAGKTIATIPPDLIGYTGIRGLKYDEKGAVIENEEKFFVRESCSVSAIPVPEHHITSTFMFVYSPTNSNQLTDTLDNYGFCIQDPMRDLLHEFTAGSSSRNDSRTTAEKRTQAKKPPVLPSSPTKDNSNKKIVFLRQVNGKNIYGRKKPAIEKNHSDKNDVGIDSPNHQANPIATASVSALQAPSAVKSSASLVIGKRVNAEGENCYDVAFSDGTVKQAYLSASDAENWNLRLEGQSDLIVPPDNNSASESKEKGASPAEGQEENQPPIEPSEEGVDAASKPSEKKDDKISPPQPLENHPNPLHQAFQTAISNAKAWTSTTSEGASGSQCTELVNINTELLTLETQSQNNALTIKILSKFEKAILNTSFGQHYDTKKLVAAIVLSGLSIIVVGYAAAVFAAVNLGAAVLPAMATALTSFVKLAASYVAMGTTAAVCAGVISYCNNRGFFTVPTPSPINEVVSTGKALCP